MKIPTFLTLALLCMEASAQRFYTVWVDARGLPGATNEFALAPHETLEVVGWKSANWSRLTIEKNGAQFSYDEISFRYPVNALALPGIWPEPLIVTGPLTVRVSTATTNNVGFWTFKIHGSPTVSATNATITLESSADLSNWTATTNGFYPGTRFFRMKLE